MKSKTNSLGPNTSNLCINLQTKDKDTLFLMARESGLKPSEYCRVILSDAVRRGVKVEIKHVLSDGGEE